MQEVETKWIERYRKEKQLYMIGMRQEATEQVMKKGRKIQNRLMEFAQHSREQINWNKDWNEEEETKQIAREIKEYETEYNKIRKEVKAINIRTANYKERIESKWFCLRKGALENNEEKARYAKEFKKRKRRLDRINQSVLTEEKARIRYKVREEEMERIFLKEG